MGWQGGSDYYSGDFDADGKTDLLRAHKLFNNNVGTLIHDEYEIYTDVTNSTPSSATVLYNKPLSNNSSISLPNSKMYNFMSADYNGDGREDVLELKLKNEYFSTCVNNNGYRLKIEDIIINKTVDNTVLTGQTTFDEQILLAPIDHLGSTYNFVSDNGKCMIPGDFDGDGIQDYIIMTGILRKDVCSNTDPLIYKAFITNIKKNEINFEITNFGVTGVPSYPNYAGSIINSDFINVIDFNGDGKSEILVVKDQLAYILQINKNVSTNWIDYNSEIIYTTNLIKKDYKIYIGDFNGDGKSDILIKNLNDIWKILYSNGENFLVTDFNFNHEVNFTSNFDTKINIGDFNGDGKSDILHGYLNMDGNFASNSTIDIYYSNGKNSNDFEYESNFYNKVFGHDDFIIGDFNGDSKADVAAHINDVGSGVDLIYFNANSKSRLLKKVINGFGSYTKVDYQLLSDKETDHNFYQRLIELDENITSYPYNIVQLPLYVAKIIKTQNILNGENITEFYYKDAILHRLGKGFLGFKEVYSKDNVSDMLIKSINELNTDFAIPLNVKKSVTYIPRDELMSESYFSHSIVDLSASNNGVLSKKYWIKMDNTLELDYFGNKGSETKSIYDNYGNLTQTQTKFGAKNGLTVLPIEIKTINTSYIAINNSIHNMPSQVTSIVSIQGSNNISNTETFNYYSNGNLQTNVKFSGLNNSISTYYNYNNFGNVINTTTNASGINSVLLNSIYDLKGRFATNATIISGNLSMTQSKTFNTKLGLITSETSNDCQTSYNEYDNFGFLKSSTSPIGKIINYSKVWEIDNSNYRNNPKPLYYYLTNYNGGSPDTKKHINKFGLEWKLECVASGNYELGGLWHTVLTAYDYKSNIKSKTNKFFPGIETPKRTLKFYDEFNREISTIDQNGTQSISYENLYNGNTKISVTDRSGNTTIAENDAIGKLIKTTDNGGNLFYKYDSKGKQIEVKHGNTIMVTTTYDIYGNKINMTDLSNGTTSYEYNAIGLQTKETDSKGNITNLVYDGFNRLVSKNIQEGTTYYNYNNNPTCNNQNIANVVNYNGITTEITYDNFSRILSEKQKFPNNNVELTKHYEYNSVGLTKQITYNNNIWLNYEYDFWGYPKKVYYNQVRDNPTNFIYETGDVDGEGRQLNFKLGNDRTTTLSYQGDFPNEKFTHKIQHLSYVFDVSTGNLTTRNDLKNNQTEMFSFDNLDRLTKSIVNNTIQTNLTFDGIANESFGNITSKTDVGYYTYNSTKKNTLSFTTELPIMPGQNAVLPTPSNQVPVSNQKIIYTSFSKPQSIEEGNYLLNFVYGTDDECVKTELFENGISIEEKYYFGEIEIQKGNSFNREMVYVASEVGNIAVIIKELNSITPFYTYTDHLGSITVVTDKYGEVIKEQNFDAWGRNRNPSNWNNYLNSNTFNVNEWLNKGYTGHEMLPYFGLINMGERLYDPLLGMMLSADNYIPNSTNTKGYNRYAYALNNPLKYVDPDGNFPWLAVGIGAAFGAWTGGSIENGTTNPFKWKKWGYAAGGLVIGGISGGFGAYISSTSMAFSNTLGIVSSSFVNSVGMSMLTGGKIEASLSFGLGNYNFQSGSFDLLWQKGNTKLQNLGYIFGAMANLQDLVAWNVGADYWTNSKGGSVSHASLHSGTTQTTTPETLISFMGQTGAKNIYDHGFMNFLEYLYNHRNFQNGQFYSSVDGIAANMPLNTAATAIKGWKFNLHNVNKKVINFISKNLQTPTGSNSVKGFLGFGNAKYGFLSGCQGMVARSLLSAGVIISPFSIHPYILNLQLLTRQVGIYASPFLNRKM